MILVRLLYSFTPRIHHKGWLPREWSLFLHVFLRRISLYVMANFTKWTQKLNGGTVVTPTKPKTPQNVL